MELVKKIEINKIAKFILISVFGTLVLAISAKIKIPFYPVPMTMQTFVVLFIGIAFGYKIGLATVSLYLLEGIYGLPVFSNSPEKGVGLIYFTGPTMGYLLGFLVAVYIAGFRLNLINLRKDKYFKYLNTILIFIKLMFSVSFIYLLGLLWLGNLIGWDKPIYKLGAEPFLLAEFFKIVLLTILYPWISKINKII